MRTRYAKEVNRVCTPIDRSSDEGDETRSSKYVTRLRRKYRDNAMLCLPGEVALITRYFDVKRCTSFECIKNASNTII